MSAEEKKEKDLDSMTVKELREFAAEETDLAGVHAMKKAELLTAIKGATGVKEEKAEETPEKEAEKALEEKTEKAPKKKAGKAPKKKADKEPVTVKGLKEKVIQLKESREEARKAKDKRMVDMLRRRINRSKKRMRKISKA
jgi:hypothetical protein